MQKADSNSPAGYVADSSTKDEIIGSSSHDTKPNVSGLPSLSNVNDFFQSGNIYYKSSPDHSLKS